MAPTWTVTDSHVELRFTDQTHGGGFHLHFTDAGAARLWLRALWSDLPDGDAA